MKIGITGATGQLGALVVEQLKNRTDASNLVALVRTPEKVEGVEARAFDYNEPGGLAQALEDIDSLLLISGNEIGQRARQHENVINAAKEAGYCRAVRDGNRIHVSGTTATHGSMMIGGNDVAAQTHFIIDKIEGSIESLGGNLADVVRTRIFVNNIDDWEPAARAHGDRFNGINPANTLVEARLVGEGYRVEIEAEAVVK
jgi:uncharacterized protein YbjT (DUF2867 family)